MERNASQPSPPLHEALLADPEQMLAIYDQAAQEIIEVGRPEGYFDDWLPEELVWPPSRTPSGPLTLDGLLKQASLVDAIYMGVPARREARLAEAHAEFIRATPGTHAATHLYLELERLFVARGAGSQQDFLHLFQGLYLDALASAGLYAPDEGEAALERARITRAPLAHAQASAEALALAAETGDPRLDALYTAGARGSLGAGGAAGQEAPLREHLLQVARGAIAAIAAGDLVATRYNTYTNFAWFGSSAWKVILDVQILLKRIAASPLARHADPKEVAGIAADVRRAQAKLIEFFQAHREDPARIKPASYWYGHQYSYLTRDMIDATRALIARANRLGAELMRMAPPGSEELAPIPVPPLLAGRASGRFLEYPHVGRQSEIPTWQRVMKLAGWIGPSLANGRKKRALGRSTLGPAERREIIWRENVRWAETTLRTFGVDVRVSIAPEFPAIARALDLGSGKRKILFLPTHQGLLDHPIMYCALASPELLAAMGWSEPVPCSMFARAGLGMAGIRIGKWSTTMFGVSAREFDHLLETVDGYVIADRTGDARNAIQRFAKVLEERPGVLYPALTTAAFAIQSPPLQHVLFALLPQDVVIIPVAIRGSHSLWPKCPKGNLNLNPGLAEVVVAPPMLGETTLLPRRRTLRIQIEAAALFQAVHLTHLLNPEPAPATRAG